MNRSCSLLQSLYFYWNVCIIKINYGVGCCRWSSIIDGWSLRRMPFAEKAKSMEIAVGTMWRGMEGERSTHGKSVDWSLTCFWWQHHSLFVFILAIAYVSHATVKRGGSRRWCTTSERWCVRCRVVPRWGELEIQLNYNLKQLKRIASSSISRRWFSKTKWHLEVPQLMVRLKLTNCKYNFFFVWLYWHFYWHWLSVFGFFPFFLLLPDDEIVKVTFTSIPRRMAKNL